MNCRWLESLIGMTGSIYWGIWSNRQPWSVKSTCSTFAAPRLQMRSCWSTWIVCSKMASFLIWFPTRSRRTSSRKSSRLWQLAEKWSWQDKNLPLRRINLTSWNTLSVWKEIWKPSLIWCQIVGYWTKIWGNTNRSSIAPLSSGWTTGH